MRLQNCYRWAPTMQSYSALRATRNRKDTASKCICCRAEYPIVQRDKCWLAVFMGGRDWKVSTNLTLYLHHVPSCFTLVSNSSVAPPYFWNSGHLGFLYWSRCLQSCLLCRGKWLSSITPVKFWDILYQLYSLHSTIYEVHSLQSPVTSDMMLCNFMGKQNIAQKTWREETTRWDDNIKIMFKERGWELVEWIYLAQETDLWWGHVSMVMNLWVPKM
jgi:hypothetical protein